jgi:hypothetical protein
MPDLVRRRSFSPSSSALGRERFASAFCRNTSALDASTVYERFSAPHGVKSCSLFRPILQMRQVEKWHVEVCNGFSFERASSFPEKLNERADCVLFAGVPKSVERHALWTSAQIVKHRSGDLHGAAECLTLQRYHTFLSASEHQTTMHRVGADPVDRHHREFCWPTDARLTSSCWRRSSTAFLTCSRAMSTMA